MFSRLPIDYKEIERREDLRKRAAARLAGEAAAKGAMDRAADALSVLHNLAANPATAPSALALLHELQVNQVEVDLQTQELQESRAELEAALRRQIELYEHQPAGCFTIDSQMVLHELNLTGAEMLGVERDAAFGSALDAFMSADSARQFRAAVSSIDAGARRATCLLKLCPKQGTERPVLASIGVDPAARRYIVNLANTANTAGEPGPGGEPS